MHNTVYYDAWIYFQQQDNVMLTQYRTGTIPFGLLLQYSIVNKILSQWYVHMLYNLSHHCRLRHKNPNKAMMEEI
jgi:hypothetical protein